MNNNKLKLVKDSKKFTKSFIFECSSLIKETQQQQQQQHLLYKQIPLVVLFGWAGSTDQLIQKYQNIYKQLGYHTIRFSPSNKLSFFTSQDEHQKCTYEFLDQIKNVHNLIENKILIHSFSNASLFIIYMHLLPIIKENEEYNFFYQNQKGLIFDSCPALPSKYSVLIPAIAKLNGLKWTVPSYMIATLMTLHVKARVQPNIVEKMLKIVIEDERNIPNLLFVSMADTMIDANNLINNYYIKRKMLYPNQINDLFICNDADHVAIYSKYPNDYLNRIKIHLNKCNLQIENGLINLNESSLINDSFHTILPNIKSKL
jgi:hypothetical protein